MYMESEFGKLANLKSGEGESCSESDNICHEISLLYQLFDACSQGEQEIACMHEG